MSLTGSVERALMPRREWRPEGIVISGSEKVERRDAVRNQPDAEGRGFGPDCEPWPASVPAMAIGA